MKKLVFICLFLIAAAVSLKAQTQAQFAQGLDGPHFLWTRLGQFGVITTASALTHDNVDGYYSGNVGDRLGDGSGGKGGVRTSVIGPGTLTFWWKASCESGFDKLGFWMGVISAHTEFPEEPNALTTGPAEPWTQETFLVPEGTQYLEWVYWKDESDSDGEDRGYLDQIYFIPDPPTITNQPLEEVTIVPVGSNVTFSVGYIVSGFPQVAAPTGLIWQRNGTNLVGKTNSTLSLTNVQVNQSGEYRAVITNNYGSSTSEVAMLEVFQPVLFETGLDTTNLAWTTSGDVNWYAALDGPSSHDGVDVARSGLAPEDFEQLSLSSYLQTTVVGPGVLKFWWRLSGLETDQFYMSVGGVIKTNAPNEDGDWEEATVAVPTGSKVVKFTYLRDDFISTDDSDGGYLDQFRFIPATNAPPRFTFPSFSTNGFSATITHDPNRAYRIQRSTNLTTWVDVTNFNTSENLFEFLDPEALNFSRRYYRVITE